MNDKKGQSIIPYLQFFHAHGRTPELKENPFLIYKEIPSAVCRGDYTFTWYP